ELEAGIAAVEREISSFEESYADPAVARDGDKMRAVRSEIEGRKRTLSAMMGEWEELLRRLAEEEPAVR
ncbi:MAG TPA: ABC transporter C-terminal domain-containing protein, partial [Thermoanaerobaculia bacterium]|nr:ABC transporter C-terminal domain-containing protein [Thermoanaerobaculia bacterium]